MKEVVRGEVLKLLDASIIYPISDSKWVSPTQVVPKKSRITMVENENNELIPTRIQTGWRMCIDYRKLNSVTRKDHFSLPFLDQVLERIVGHAFYCFLDGYSGYNQIEIALEDQEKTTFTCPFRTFAYRRMPFGLCNASATFQRCVMSIFSELVENVVEVFMDDFSVYGDSMDGSQGRRLHPMMQVRVMVAAVLEFHPLVGVAPCGHYALCLLPWGPPYTAQQDRNDNLMLRVENERLKNENLQLQVAIQALICPNCNNMGYDEQLRLENLQRVGCFGITSSQHIQTVEATEAMAPSLPPSSTILFREQQIDNFRDVINQAPLVTKNFSQFVGNCLFVEGNKSFVLGLAMSSMEELMKMCQATEPLWIRFEGSKKEVLNGEEHARMFQWPLKFQQDRGNEFIVEASRHTAVVAISSFMLVDAFLDVKKWVKLFPSIVSRATTLQVVNSGILGHASGSLHLMYAELQFPSPLVPTREALFLRYCQLNKEEGTWVIVDFPFESMDGSCQPSSPRYKRRPSGCIIKDLSNGCSKVTWVEQAEVEYTPIHKIFYLFFNSGRAFEAQHWLAVLQRQSERLASLVATNVSNLGGMQITEARKKLMNLAGRMTKTFFVNMSSSCGQTWMALSDCADDTIRITTRSITEPCQPIGLILAIASTSWLPYSPFLAFNLVKDEHCRALQLDVLSNVTSLQEVVHIASGSHPGNCVSLFRINVSMHTFLLSLVSMEFILQESSISDTSGVVVFSTLNIDSLQLAMSNQDQSCIPLLPLGFIIHPMGALLVNDYSITGEVNGVPNSGFESLPGQGCLLTVGLQVLVSTNPTEKLEYSDIFAISKPLCDIVHKINTNSDRGGDDGAGCANNGGNVGVSTKPVAQDEPSLQQD
ncbi:homeobox-leucine zipper protein HDG5-like [Diospyros lotus]|uniref:homeobox-leucine zipper protein HDG5-like n=1 Tax=Diospyros lotus TaxID=55363 RepID=UPI00224F1EC3|nr:homeobox-leucine zipper protein HDG5-like [Diospyros lotus]